MEFGLNLAFHLNFFLKLCRSLLIVMPDMIQDIKDFLAFKWNTLPLNEVKNKKLFTCFY